MGIAFNFIVNFMIEGGTPIGYCCIFIAILGVGGVYSCLYTLVGLVMPKEQVGGAMVIIVTIGAGSSLSAPLVTLCPKPVP